MAERQAHNSKPPEKLSFDPRRMKVQFVSTFEIKDAAQYDALKVLWADIEETLLQNSMTTSASYEEIP